MGEEGIEEEVLPLDLTGEQAAVLVVICGRSIGVYNDLRKIIKEELKKALKKRSEKLGDDVLHDHLTELTMLIENTQYLYAEAGKIVIELDSNDDKPRIIMKPNFGG